MMIQVPILAYIDPGSGAVLMQVILSGLIALFIFLRTRALSLVRLPFRAGKGAGAGRPSGPSTETDEAAGDPRAFVSDDRACRR
jgi:hypothetical protein